MELLEEAARRQAIAWVLRLTKGTPLAPGPYERTLLERYARGQLSLDRVEQLLAARPAEWDVQQNASESS